MCGGRWYGRAAALVLVLLVLLGTMGLWTSAEVSLTQIPVIVNIYPGSNTTEKQARDAIDEASDILKQAGLKLVVVDVNTGSDCKGDDGSGGGTAGDGRLTEDELDNVMSEGGKEIAATPNQRGIKICFVDEPASWVPGAVGVAVHRNPTIAVKRRNTTQETGETIAHEIGHVMTLGAYHKIDGSTNADNGGHTPDKAGNSGNGNLMASAYRRVGTHLTADQRSEMATQRYVHGKCATQWEQAYPALKDQTAFGFVPDPLDDPRYELGTHDLTQVRMWSVEGSPVIDFQITTRRPIDPDEQDRLLYRIGLDADGNPDTGIFYAGIEGIDREIVVVVANEPRVDPYIAGFVRDFESERSIELPWSPVYEIDYLFIDPNMDGLPYTASLLMQVPKEYLRLAADEVPVVVVTGADAPIDTADFIYHQDRWQKDPTLTTTGTGIPVPGEPYAVLVEGLEPGSLVLLYLDDRIVLEGRLDENGRFEGEFLVPRDVTPEVPHFLTAQDMTGEFAYSMTCPSIWEE